METNPADIYQSKSPSVAELLDTLRDCAINLSDAIKTANARGIDVHVQKAPEGSSTVVQLVFCV